MALPACGFAVYADRAGQLPLAIERRAKGKRVTVINGVKGNARALCQSLTTLLGVGGTVHSKGQLFDVEVQGEQTERVSSALRQLACVRGPGGVKLKEPAVVERACAYDDFLRDQEGPSRRKERRDAGPREPPEPPENELDDSLVWDDEERVSPQSASAPLSASQLDVLLQRLGLMAAVGPAVESYRLELQAARNERAQPKASLCAVQPAKEPAALFTCGECGASFTMRRTLELHKKQHLTSANSVTNNEAPAWRWDSMSQARQDADLTFIPEVFNEVVTSVGLANDLDDFLSPEEAQYLVPENSKYTLGSLLDHAVPVVSRNRRRKAGRAQTYRPCPVCDVDFPESTLEEHVEECLRLNERDTGLAGPINGGTASQVEMETLPEELLESLLQLQLPPEASDVFWSAYDIHQRGMSVHDAFLAALEEAVTWIPEGCNENLELHEPSTATATCPVCHLEAPAATIEDHVEQCLVESSAPRKSRWNRGIDVDPLPGEKKSLDVERKKEKEIEKEIEKEENQKMEEEEKREEDKKKEKEKKRREELVKSEENFSKDVVQESAQDRISRLKREAKARKSKAAS